MSIGNAEGTTPSASATWVIQAPERPGPRDPRTNYRQGFKDFVAKHHPQAHAVILESDPSKIPELQHMWRGHPTAVVIDAVWCEDPQCTKTHELFSVSTPAGQAIVAEDEFSAQRFNPAAEPSRHSVSCWSIAQRATGSEIGLLSSDIAGSSQVDSIRRLDVSVVSELMVTTIDAPESDATSAVELLVSRAFRAAGRPWGEAGSGQLLVRNANVVQSLRAISNQLRVDTGEKLVKARENLPLGENRPFFGRSLRARIKMGHSSDLNIDPTFGKPLSPIRRSTVEDAIKAALHPKYTFEIEVDEPDPDEVARECFEELGVFPISFSHPSMLPLRTPTRPLSAIIPGFPYSFDDEASYLAHYADSNMAITHRKAGWDCFRHVEIAASGAIPLMPDVHEIPRYAMTHYPKRAYAEILDHVLQGGTPGPETRRQLREYFVRFQATETLSRYVLRMSGLPDAQDVLFLDEALPQQPDYLSVLSLIGLKQLLGNRCVVAFPVPYIYDHHAGPMTGLYGKGFGYTRVLPEAHQSDLERIGAARAHLLDAMQRSDAVVVGSAYRNLHLVDDVLQQVAPEKLILLYGEDTPPLSSVLQGLKGASASLFVRPIHA